MCVVFEGSLLWVRVSKIAFYFKILAIGNGEWKMGNGEWGIEGRFSRVLAVTESLNFDNSHHVKLFKVF